jgi:hypothetical protein
MNRHHRPPPPPSTLDHASAVCPPLVRALSFTSHCRWASPSCSSCLCHARATRDPSSEVFVHLEVVCALWCHASPLNQMSLHWGPPSRPSWVGPSVVVQWLSSIVHFPIAGVELESSTRHWALHRATRAGRTTVWRLHAMRAQSAPTTHWPCPGAVGCPRPMEWGGSMSPCAQCCFSFSYLVFQYNSNQIQFKFESFQIRFKLGIWWICSQALNWNRKFELGL